MKLLNQKQMAMALTAVGAVPFLILSVLVYLGQPSLLQLPLQPQPFTPALILHIYAVIIASFVAGLHWGIHFCKRTADNVYLFSSAIALLLLVSMVFAGSTAGFALVLLGFLLLWMVEYRLSLQRVTTAWFWQLRSGVTAVVSVCLLVAMLSV